MEGYLYKKGRQESKVARRNWKKRWFVLDGTFLIYFEDYNQNDGKPINRKGIYPLLGCEAKPFPHHEKKYTFHIVHSQRNSLYLHADSQKSADGMYVYMTLFQQTILFFDQITLSILKYHSMDISHQFCC
jgi:hypothetical protein